MEGEGLPSRCRERRRSSQTASGASRPSPPPSWWVARGLARLPRVAAQRFALALGVPGGGSLRPRAALDLAAEPVDEPGRAPDPGPSDRTPGASQARVPRGLPTPTNSHLFQPRLTKSREFSGRPTRGNSRIEGTRPVRSGLPPPPSRPANLDREETRAGFPYGFRGFCQSQGNTRRVERAQRAALSLPVSDLDFRGERLRRRLPRGCSVCATVATDGRSRSVQGDTAGAASGSPVIELVPTTHGFTGDLGGVRSSDLICQHLAVAGMARTVDLTVDIPKATRHPEASQEARKSR